MRNLSYVTTFFLDLCILEIDQNDLEAPSTSFVLLTRKKFDAHCVLGFCKLKKKKLFNKNFLRRELRETEDKQRSE